MFMNWAPIRNARRRISKAIFHDFLRHPAPSSFVMLTTSRSGSTFLCDLLSRAFRAEPVTEDFRPEDTAQLMEGVLSFEEYLKRCKTVFEKIRVFPCIGTKLICDDMPDVASRLTASEISMVHGLWSDFNPCVIRLIRRDRHAQAVSRYIASSTSVYHRIGINSSSQAVGDVQNESTTKQSPPDRMPGYDFEAIHSHLKVIASAESLLDATASHLTQPTMTVFYEDLARDAYGTLLETMTFLAQGSKKSAYLQRRADKAVNSNQFKRTGTQRSMLMKKRFTKDMLMTNSRTPNHAANL